MKQFVRDWMTSPVIVVPPEIFVDQALSLMRRRGIHSLVIDLSADDGNVYGIVTTTDIRDEITAVGLDPAEVRVSEIMTSPIKCAKTSWTVRKAAQAMEDSSIHHLPVEDTRASLVGVISVTDVFTAVEEVGWTEIS
ncbi:MAG: CBS domain-containing protein [Chloroflexi bacterium]|nr:CBS domain-containing protein [Chloroflexota bacterium]